MAEQAAVSEADSGPHAAAAEERRLFNWVEAVCGGRIARSVQASGGNRARSWALDVARGDGTTAEVFLRYSLPRPPSVEPYTTHREAQVYRAIDAAGLQAPRLIAEHPDLPALLTDRAAGIAEFRRLKDPAAKTRIISEFMQTLARLHALDVAGVRLDAGVEAARIIDHVHAEICIWRAMYEETAVRDPLIEFAFRWLEAAIPDPDDAPVLAHGDAGPGNFLFEDGRLTAVIDWELAHLGDPMEDLAWFSMRCVMEPAPDFNGALRAYAGYSGRPLDHFRILYHRVLVSARVVVIRHRNVTGEPGNAIVSRALNRRLLVQAIADGAGVAVHPLPPPSPPPTARSELYGRALDDLRDVVAARSTDRAVVSAAKAASKVLKYLSAYDRYGAALEAIEINALSSLLGDRPVDLVSGRARLAEALEQGAIDFQLALDFFALQTAGEALLAADASGGIAGRGYPPLQITEPQ
jgi:aminoglycoside phosphotransferase (APT) family kinase protein